jgi:biofilm PGA synthesis N-glycosyltransferase PgaC
MTDLVSILEAVQHHFVYYLVLSYFAWYPIFSSAVWVITSLLFFVRREVMGKTANENPRYTPPVTVLIAAFNEERNIERTIEGLLRIDYPDYEIVIVDDGSTDGTVGKIMPYVLAGKLRLVRKLVNEGKAMALNDALRCTRGEILLIMDADAVPDEKILRYMVPHFQSPRVGAVTGNPRVFNRESFLGKLQAIEFTSIISLQRRAQRVWGRILTMSGVVACFHRQALMDAGLFSPDMATEDIDLTWKLQLKFYDVRYEPRAIVWMRVPQSFRGLWRQRRRWAKGLIQVLKRRGRQAMNWKSRRLWPIVIESTASVCWAYCFVLLTGVWVVSYSAGYPPVGASPIPNWWGMLIGSMCLVQLLTGVILDRKYDRRLYLYYFVAVFYPLIYWVLMAVVTTVSTPGALFKHRVGVPTKWKPVRE